MNLNQADFDYVRALVRDQSAIVLDSDKRYLVEARLLSLTAREGLASLGALIGRLRAGGGAELERKIIEAMTTNETMFFRDGHPFDALRCHILPDLIARRQEARALNIWCGASSSGQEPYSILMVLREHFPQLASWRVFFLATDLSNEILARAREGRYNQIEVKRGLPAPLLARYFEPSGAFFQIRRELRQAIEFRQLNLCKAWPPLPEMDLVFLRNVLIYFDVETKRAILGRVRRLMRPDAYLVVGTAETTMNLDDAFAPVTYDRTVCYKLKP